MKHHYILGLVILWILGPAGAFAQHKIAYVDTDYIYKSYPEFATAQQKVNRMADQWEGELDQRQNALDELYQEYQARELLYTMDERQRKQNEIISVEEEIERLRRQYFGPEGELFKQEEQILRPIQEKVLEVIEEIAQSEGYDYVFNNSGRDFVFLYTEDRLDISDLVLEELGIDVQPSSRGQ